MDIRDPIEPVNRKATTIILTLRRIAAGCNLSRSFLFFPVLPCSFYPTELTTRKGGVELMIRVGILSGIGSVIGLFVFELLLVALLPGNELQRYPFEKTPRSVRRKSLTAI